MPKITRNFSLDEFRVSSEFPELAKKIIFSKEDLRNIELLSIMLLQPIRDKIGGITILSGKRSFELNKAVGGSKSSDHLTGSAVDIITGPGSDILTLYGELLDRESSLGQLILYTDKNDKPAFVHVSLPSKRHYSELLIKHEDDPVFYRSENEYFYRLLNRSLKAFYGA